MPVGPPNWWLLYRMILLTKNTLNIIEESDREILANIFNNNNVISGNNTFTGYNVFTGNTILGNCIFNILEGQDVVIGGNLSGNTQLNIQGNLVINGETTFNGETSFNGNIISNVSINNSLTVNGETSFNGETAFNGNIISNVSINNSLTVNDASTFNQTLNIKEGGITLGNTSTFNSKVIFNGNVRFDGGFTETFREVITANTNYIVLNANIKEQNFDFTYPAGFIIETHDVNIPHGYLFFDLSADRFWDLSGDNLSGNILQANTLRGNIIESSGTHKITFNSNIAVPFLFGNVSGNTATFSGNVTATNFIGDLSGNVTGTVSSLSNHNTNNLREGNLNLYFTSERVRSNVFAGTGVTYHQSSGTFSIGQSVRTTDDVSFGNVTATNFIGDLSGNVRGDVTGTVSSLSNHNTYDLREGSNLYFTVDRVRSNVSGGTGVTYHQSSGTFSIGQSVGTTDDVSFGNVTATNFIGDLSGNVRGDVTGTVSSLSNHNTYDLREGSNLYFTVDRVRSNVSGGTGVTYHQSSGTFSIGQSVGTTDDVSFGNVTASLFNGNLHGDYATLTDNVRAPLFIGNIRTNSILPINGNITLTANIHFDSIQANTTSNISITGNMGVGWYPLMYNPNTKQLAYGPPPY